MALHGEVTREIGGKTYTFKLGINAMVDLQRQFSTEEKPVTFQAIFQRASMGDAEAIRAIVWACLRKHHKDLTQDQVGDLIDDAGMTLLGDVMTEIGKSASPDVADLTALGVRQPRPRKSQTATN